jgi:hypothetical protein
MLVISGNELLIVFFFLIGLNAFFTFKQRPILAFPIIGISVIFLIGFEISFDGFDILMTFILIAFMLGNLVSNWQNYKH